MLSKICKYAYSASQTVRFSFILRDGSRKEVEAVKGKHILEVAKENDV